MTHTKGGPMKIGKLLAICVCIYIYTSANKKGKTPLINASQDGTTALEITTDSEIDSSQQVHLSECVYAYLIYATTLATIYFSTAI